MVGDGNKVLDIYYFFFYYIEVEFIIECEVYCFMVKYFDLDIYVDLFSFIFFFIVLRLFVCRIIVSFYVGFGGV